MAAMTGRSAEIGLVPHDPEAMRSFYGEVLGLPLHSEMTVPGGILRRFRCGRTIVKHLCLDKAPPQGPTGTTGAFGLRLLTLVLPDFEAVLSRVAARTGRMPKVHDMRALAYAFSEDPDGTTIELVGLKRPLTEEGIRVQAGLCVRDLVRTRAFYEGTLGWTVTDVKEHDGFTITTLDVGRMQVKFWQGPAGLPSPPLEPSAAAGLRYLTFFVADVEEAIAPLAAAGMRIPVPPRPFAETAVIAFAADPDGALLEFVGPRTGIQALRA